MPSPQETVFSGTENNGSVPPGKVQPSNATPKVRVRSLALAAAAATPSKS